MHQKIPNPKSRNELAGMRDETLITYVYDNGLFVNNYSMFDKARNEFINIAYNAQFTQIREDFCDIMDNPAYFEREGETRYYLICTECGPVTRDCIDHQTEYLDLHCKCGAPMYYADYTDDEIDGMRRRHKESVDYGRYAMQDIYKEMKQEFIESHVNKVRKQLYYGYR